MRRILCSFATSIGVLFFAFGVQAETITQTSAQATNLGLFGGQIRYIQVDPNSNYVYAGAYSPNGFFISDDDGETWNGVPDDLDFGEPRGIALSDDGDLFFIASKAFRSSDKGQTFTELEEIGDYSGMIIYHDGTLLIGRTDGAISVSDDDGETFTTVTLESGSVIQSIAGSPTSGTFFAIADDNTTTTLYKTMNSGTSWSAVDTSEIPARMGLVTVSPDNPNNIIVTLSAADEHPWRSVNGGTDWSELSSVSPYATAATYDTNGRIYLGVQYSDDNGDTWSSVNPATPASRVSGIVLPDPSNPDVLFGGSFAAIAKSTDTGATWADNNEGLTAVLTYDVAQSANKQTVWVATNAGLAKTENYLSNDRTWEFPIYYDVYPTSVWVSPSDAETVVVGGMGAIVKTTNGGDSWTTSSGWNTDFTPRDIVHSPVTPTTLYAVGNVSDSEEFKTGGVYTSTDSGSTWSSMSFPSNLAAQAISIASDGALYVGVGNLDIRGDGGTGIYRFDDGSWTELTDAPNMEITSVLVDPNSDSILYATAADFDTYGADSDTVSGLYKSVDQGTTWERITEGLENGTKFRAMGVQYSTSPTTLYLSGTDKLSGKGVIYKSSNRGNSWGEYYTGLKNETFNSLLFDGLIAGNSRGVYSIKSFARVKLSTKKKKVATGSIVTLNIQLLDKATSKKLGKRKVVIQRKFGKNGTFKNVKTVRLGKKGKINFQVKVNRNTRYRVRFTPKRAIDKEEYTKSFSKVLKMNVEK